MKPYYQRENVILYNCDCREFLPTIAAGSVDLVLTDPPYFRVKSEEWDNQWKSDAAFLDWLESIIQEWRRVLKPNGSLYCFASPQMSARVECEIAKSFNVLNCIRWQKEAGWHNKTEKEALREFLSPWESCIFAEQFGCEYDDAATALHKDVYAPLGRYIQQERERAGVTRNDVEVALGFVSTGDPTRGTALCYRWEEGSSLPTKETYERLRAFLTSRGGEYLRREYEDLRREYEDLRRPFFATPNTPYTDVWTFPTVGTRPDKHICEKPYAMMEHIIRTSSRAGAVVLDCFMGSGVVGEAARFNGRQFIGIEKDAYWVREATNRIGRIGGDAARRIDAELDKGRLFEPSELEQPRQLALTETT